MHGINFVRNNIIIVIVNSDSEVPNLGGEGLRGVLRRGRGGQQQEEDGGRGEVTWCRLHGSGATALVPMVRDPRQPVCESLMSSSAPRLPRLDICTPVTSPASGKAGHMENRSGSGVSP